MKEKILFISPPYHAGVVEVAGSWVPLYFVYLAGAARASGVEPVIYDAMTKGVGHREIEEKIREVRPRYVATTSITCTLPDALCVLETAKRVDAGIITLLGGVHPTFMYEEAFGLSPNVDFIVRGEGELTLAELLQALEKNRDPSGVKGLAYKKDGAVVTTPPRPLMEEASLDTLEKAWDKLEWDDYQYYIIPGSRLGAVDTSRGCTKECSFCSQRKFWEESWRARSPESVVEDIVVQNKTYGVNVFLLTDDYPTKDRLRWAKFLDLLIERDLGVYLLMETRVEDILRDADILSKYRAAGIIHIYVGTERGDQETLDLIKKDIRVEDAKEALRLLDRAGIITETSMILGLPHDTPETIESTLKLALEYNPDFCHFLAIAPWPYADMYAELKDRVRVFDYKRYNLIDPVVEPEAMTLKDIDRAIVDCYRRFYMNKFRDIAKMTDEFKRDYILEAMRRIMTCSFIVDKIGGLGEMPEDVARELQELKGSAPKAAVGTGGGARRRS